MTQGKVLTKRNAGITADSQGESIYTFSGHSKCSIDMCIYTTSDNSSTTIFIRFFLYQPYQCSLCVGKTCRNKTCRNKTCRNKTCRNKTCRNKTCRNKTCRNKTCRNKTCRNKTCRNKTCRNKTCRNKT